VTEPSALWKYSAHAPASDLDDVSTLPSDAVADDAPDDVRSAAHDAWMAALEAINALDLRLGGTRVMDFKVDSRGECEFKLGW
jgi:hypothetical protein